VITAVRTDPGSTNRGPWIYTTRLQKGGALLDDMRQLVRAWSEAPVATQRDTGVRTNILNKDTRTRLADVYRRAFLPRFVDGPIPNAWKIVRPLEDVVRVIATQTSLGEFAKRRLERRRRYECILYGGS
jgi:hypothetical protein